MIIMRLCDLFYNIITTLLSWVNVPSLSDDTLYDIEMFTDVLCSGANLIRYFIPTNIFHVGLPIFLFLLGFEYLYYLIMWILKKIPVVGIE